MAITESPDLIYQDELRQLARKLDAAGHGKKGAIKKRFMDLYDVHLQTLHRQLKNIGWTSGRKRRSDAGSTSMDQETLVELSAALKAGVRKNGKATMEIPNARALLAANGREFKVGNSQLRNLLRQQKMDLATQKQPTPHTNMRSLHPNHVHQVDPSLCLLYYSPDGKQRVMRDDEIYKNKPEFIEQVGNLKCWRYVLTDHYSNTVLVRYYQAKGETQENLYDFLLWCWMRVEGRPFHGLPKLLVWDKGSANTSSAIKQALKAFPVEHYEHEAGNPRAKGSVEGANNLVEKLFESRLLYEPVCSVDELNAAAEAWQNAYNADCIPEYDAKLRRKGMRVPMARFDIWQRIRQEQLRLLPDIEICRYLLTAKPESRLVRGDMKISFVHPVAKRSIEYDLRGVDGVYPRLKVMVSPLVMGGEFKVIVAIEDYQGELIEHVIDPVAFDEMGMPVDAPVWGQDFKSQPDTEVEQVGKKADEAAYPNKDQKEIKKAKNKREAPFGGLDAHSHLKDVYTPDYLVKRGTELHVPDRSRVEVKPLTHIEICRSLVGKMGRSLTTEENQWIRSSYPDGMPEEELPALAERLSKPQTQRPGLAVVN